MPTNDMGTTIELLKLIDAAGQNWDSHPVERVHWPGISRGGLQLLTVLKWAEGVIEAPPRRRTDFERWCHLVAFGGDPASLARPDQTGRSYDYLARAERLAAAAAGLGIDIPPPFGPLTFKELQDYAAVLSMEASRSNAAHGPSVLVDALQPATINASKASHSPDFTSVVWFGKLYAFNKGRQAAAVKVLWAAFQTPTPTLSQETIGELSGSTDSRYRLADVFRKHEAFGKMIVPTGKGIYMLRKPIEPA